MNLPTWDMDGDNYHEARLTGQLMELLGRAVPQLSFSASRAQSLLREIEDKHATEYLNVLVKIPLPPSLSISLGSFILS